MEFSFRRPSPPNTYSYVQEDNSGSTRKFIQNYLLFTCIFILILAIQMQIVNGIEEPFLRQQRKISPAHVHWVYLSLCPSFCLSGS